MNDDRIVLELAGVSKFFGTLTALDDVVLQVRRGEFVTLLGPSGSGKTTTLRIVAGFMAPDLGRVLLNGRDLVGLPPHKRNIGMVFQNYALFPHMTAAENIAFPLKVRRVARAEVRRRVEDALALVRLPGLGGRLARQLSGGQQQRVALARAIVYRPPLLLMDEPLGALDKKLRDAMQLEIARISRELEMTVIYVTHDQEEALALSDRIAIYNQGRIEQVGTGAELYERPVSLFAATFMGESTILRGILEQSRDAVRLNSDGRMIGVSRTACERAGLAAGQHVAVVVRPERFKALHSPDTGVQPSVHGIVAEELYLGSIHKYVIDLSNGERAIARVPLGDETGWPSPGHPVELTWDLDHGLVVSDEEDSSPLIREASSRPVDEAESGSSA